MAKKYKSRAKGVLDRLRDYPEASRPLHAALLMPVFSQDLDRHRKQLFEPRSCIGERADGLTSFP